MESLKGKVIVVTGANGGMGKEIIKRLGSSGASFALCSKVEEGLKELSDLIDNSKSVLTKVVDVTNEAQVKSFFEDVKKNFGQADILLNLAGLSIVGNIWETLESVYDTIMDVNVKGSFLTSKYFAQITNPETVSKIINIGSKAAKVANGNAPIYCAAKAAVNSLSQGMAIQLKAKNIQVTTLNPASTDTAFWGDRPVVKDKFMQASDIAEIVEFVVRFSGKVVFNDVYFESFL